MLFSDVVMGCLGEMSGFIDKTIPELLHYFSIGKIPETQKKKKPAKTKKRKTTKSKSQNLKDSLGKIAKGNKK